MSTEKGVVEKVDNEFAWVRAQRKGGCGSCASRSHCSRIDGGKFMLVKVTNTLNAQKGDIVAFYINSAILLKYTFIVYIIPVLGLLIGALAADTLGNVTGIKPGAAILLFTLIGFCMAVWFSRIMIRRKGAGMELIPSIRRIF